MKNLIVAFLTLAVFSACENTEQKTKHFSAYFDVDSLLNVHQQALIDMPVQVRKSALLEGKTDTTTYSADSIRLVHEMNAFRKANINKPAYDDLYEINTIDSAGFNITSYIPKKKNNDLEVKKLTIFRKDDILTSIEAYVVEDHWLYDSKRNLKIEFEDILGSYTIKTFTVDGTQKMILRDRVNFNIKGTIIL